MTRPPSLDQEVGITLEDLPSVFRMERALHAHEKEEEARCTQGELPCGDIALICLMACLFGRGWTVLDSGRRVRHCQFYYLARHALVADQPLYWNALK